MPIDLRARKRHRIDLSFANLPLVVMAILLRVPVSYPAQAGSPTRQLTTSSFDVVSNYGSISCSLSFNVCPETEEVFYGTTSSGYFHTKIVLRAVFSTKKSFSARASMSADLLVQSTSFAMNNVLQRHELFNYPSIRIRDEVQFTSQPVPLFPSISTYATVELRFCRPRSTYFPDLRSLWPRKEMQVLPRAHVRDRLEFREESFSFPRRAVLFTRPTGALKRY